MQPEARTAYGMMGRQFFSLLAIVKSPSRLSIPLLAGILALLLYCVMIWWDLPPAAGLRYEPPPAGQGLTSANWWDQIQGLRGYAVRPNGWVWPLIDPAPLGRWLPLLALGFLGALLLLGVSKGKVKPWPALCALVLLGYAGQLAVIWLKHPHANQLLFERILSSDFTGYFTAATRISDPSVFFAGYDDVIAVTDRATRLCAHCRTHPPGPILFYWIPLQLVGALPPGWQEGLRDLLLGALNLTVPSQVSLEVTTQVAPLTPAQVVVAVVGGHAVLLGAALIVLPLYGLARRLAGARYAVALAALGLVVPGILTMSPEFDQIYATATATLFYVALRGLAATRNALLWGLVCGLLVALCIYWSFGLWVLLGPLLALAGAPALNLPGTTRVERQDGSTLAKDADLAAVSGSEHETTNDGVGAAAIKRIVSWAAGLILGVLVPWALLWGVGRFDLPRVLRIATEVHAFYTYRRPYAPWLLFNLTDFFQFVGLPLVANLLFTFFRREANEQRAASGEWRVASGEKEEVQSQYVHATQNHALERSEGSKPKTMPSTLSRAKGKGQNSKLIARHVNLYTLLFLGLVLGLDLSGVVRAEVGRLWLFMVPLALMGIYHAVGRQQLGGRAIAALLVAQFVVCALIGGRWLTP